jgi:AmmeMemoRadiSam system protein B
MQLPFIAHCIARSGIDAAAVTIVPILVGSLSTASHRDYGAALSRYVDDENCVFVVSSDFCHWGRRFSFTWHEQTRDDGRGDGGGDGDGCGCVGRGGGGGGGGGGAPERQIHESIEWLDRRGMSLIESGDPRAFASYLSEYNNTICGRHPISVLMHALEHTAGGGDTGAAAAFETRFTHYEQSTRVTDESDSSVSYASAVVTKR